MNNENLDGAEKALAKEFTDYLAGVSREIIDPISANVAKHQADIEKMLTKVTEARSEVESVFMRQREFMDAAREKADLTIKDSEAKLARLHSSHLALLESSRQRIVGELKSISDDAGATSHLLEESNQSTRQAISTHLQAIKELADESSSTTARIVEEGRVSLEKSFSIHQGRLEESASLVINRFEEMLDDLKRSIGELALVHEETRRRLFQEFNEHKQSAITTIESARESLSREVSAQIDSKSQEAIDILGTGVARRYEHQFDLLQASIESGFNTAGRSNDEQSSAITETLSKAITEANQSLSEANDQALTAVKSEITMVKNLLITLMLLFAGVATIALVLRP